jgi:hypothetical protein
MQSSFRKSKGYPEKPRVIAQTTGLTTLAGEAVLDAEAAQEGAAEVHPQAEAKEISPRRPVNATTAASRAT